MNKFIKTIALITTSALILSNSICSFAKTTSPSAKLKSLNFGAISSIDVVPIVVASEKGLFRREGLDVNFEAFKSPKDRDAAFQSGALDGVICDEIAMCLYNNANFNVKITGKTNGDFMLISSPGSGIKTLQELKNKSIAISEKTSIEYTLDKILENNSMTPADVKKIMAPQIPTRLELLRNNKIDAALLPEPYSTLAIKAGGTLLGSASKLATYPSVTAFTGKALLNKSAEIKAFYKAYNEAVDYINKVPIKYYEDVLIKTVGYPADMKGNIKLPKFSKNQLPSTEELKGVIAWSSQNKLITKDIKPDDLINSSYVK